MNHYYNTIIRASAFNLFLGAVVLLFEEIFGFPKMNISFGVAFFVFIVLMAAYSVIVFEVVAAIPPKIKHNLLVQKGPYAKSRHPMYAAIIFILNPAIAILLRSYFLFLAIVPAYFIWSICTNEEEKEDIKKFGHEYKKYKKITPKFFPKINLKNGIKFGFLFFSLFLFIFFLLNSTAYFSRIGYFLTQEFSDKSVKNNVAEKIRPMPTKIAGDTYAGVGAPVIMPTDLVPDPGAITQKNNPTPTTPAQPKTIGQPQAVTGTTQTYYLNGSIFIERINVSAPIVITEKTDIKSINKMLNYGAVLFPEYSLPQFGGPTVLIGHSSTYPWNKTKYGTIFALLDKLQEADKITIESAGKKFIYSVYRKEIVPYDENSYKKLENLSQNVLVLITCWPPGTTLKRYAVFANLVDVK